MFWSTHEAQQIQNKTMRYRKCVYEIQIKFLNEIITAYFGVYAYT